MELAISRENIEQGVCGSAQDCAAALALKGAGYEGVEVAGWVKFEEPGVDGGLRKYHKHKITASLQDWLSAFDEGMLVPPGRMLFSRWPVYNGVECRAGFVADAGPIYGGRAPAANDGLTEARIDCQDQQLADLYPEPDFATRSAEAAAAYAKGLEQGARFKYRR